MKSVLRRLIKAVRLLSVPLYRRALFSGVGAAVEHKPLMGLVGRKAIAHIVDIGANVGQFSLGARQWFPDATILAFEPISVSAKKYRSLFKNDPKVGLIQTAIGLTVKQMDMHVSKAVDSSSLLPIGPAQSDLFPGTEESHSERVNVAPLGAFLSDEEFFGKALLKIDVQGYELEVLRGCESLLERFCAVFVECSFIELYEGQALAHEVIDWLQRRGFYLARIGPVFFDKNGLSVQGDFLFLRNTDG